MVKPKLIPKHSVFGNYNLITLGDYKINKFGDYTWETMCTCGKILYLSPAQLKSNKYGCRQCAIDALHTIHGQARRGKTSLEYRAFNSMKSRCYNSKHKNYKDYQGRGIKVCDRWLHSFENFYKDMGPRPSRDHSIDRINNDMGYYPENCRWATRKEQARNRGTNHNIEYNGEIKTLIEWSEYLGMNKGSLLSRIRQYKWSVEKALTSPIRPKGKKA